MRKNGLYEEGTFGLIQLLLTPINSVGAYINDKQINGRFKKHTQRTFKLRQCSKSIN